MAVIGDIIAPEQLSGGYGADVTSGLVPLISNIIKVIMVVGGLWAFINIILAGITFITSGDSPDDIKKANQRMTMSGLGLVLMVGSFTLAGIFGWLLYRDATAFINPKIYGPGTKQTGGGCEGLCVSKTIGCASYGGSGSGDCGSSQLMCCKGK